MPRPPPPEPVNLPLPPSRTLLTSFTSFLTVAIHTLLHARHLYPPTTFLLARAYNTPVHQSRHPALCAWITDALAAVAAQLATGAVERVVVAVHAGSDNDDDSDSDLEDATASMERVPPGTVIEKWVFDTSRFPAYPGGAEAMREKERGGAREEEGDDERNNDAAGVNWADIDEQYRGALLRLTRRGEAMPPVRKGSTFTVAVELKEGKEAPIGHPQPWIPSNPTSQDPGDDPSAPRILPVRAVRAGPLFFECWVEESDLRSASARRKGKGRATSPFEGFADIRSQQESQAVSNSSSDSS